MGTTIINGELELGPSTRILQNYLRIASLYTRELAYSSTYPPPPESPVTSYLVYLCPTDVQRNPLAFFVV